MSHEDYNVTVNSTKPRPWGWEAQFTAIHKTTGRHINAVIPIGEKDDNKTVLTKANAYLDKRDILVANRPEPESSYSKIEVEGLLKEKGFLAEEESLEDLKTLDDLKSEGDK